MSKEILHASDIHHIFPGNDHFVAKAPIHEIHIDSRNLSNNSLFIALKTKKNDGHFYINQALNGKAVAVLSHQKEQEKQKNTIYCHDTHQALIDIATYKKSHYQCQWVGITGSVGKTSLKNMLSFALEPYQSYSTKANLNNTLGVPLMMSNTPPNAKFAILEAGMDKKGELDYIGNILKPDMTILTNISFSHISNFDNIEGIRDAKAELLWHTHHEGTLLLPFTYKYDNFWQNLIRVKNIQARYFSSIEEENSDFSLLSYKNLDGYCRCSFKIFDKKYHADLPFEGAHQALNALITLGACAAKEISVQSTLQRLMQYQLTEGRGHKMHLQLPHIGHITVIDETYNASPLAMMCVLQDFYEKNNHLNRKIAILGDMAELGNYTDTEHDKIAQFIAKKSFCSVITVGKNMEKSFKKYARHHVLANFDDKDTLINNIEALMKDKDMILLKASRCVELDKVITFLQKNTKEGKE